MRQCASTLLLLWVLITLSDINFFLLVYFTEINDQINLIIVSFFFLAVMFNVDLSEAKIGRAATDAVVLENSIGVNETVLNNSFTASQFIRFNLYHNK